MRIVKPRGRSVVEKNKNSKWERKIIPDARARDNERNDSHEIDTYLGSDVGFFLAQWGSMLDKMFYKSTHPYMSVYDAREKAGAAFLKFWNDHPDDFPHIDCSSNAFKDKWNSYVHPYELKKRKGNPPAEEQQPKITKDWFDTITRLHSIDEVKDWNEIANAVFEHLYIAQKKLHGTGYELGLVKRRYKSISLNNRNFQKDDDTGEFNTSPRTSGIAAKEQGYIDVIKTDGIILSEQALDSYRLEGLVSAIREVEDKQYNQLKKNSNSDKKEAAKFNNLLPDCVPYPDRKKVFACVYQHYGELFGDLSNKELALSEEHAVNWRYHQLIREALHKRYPKMVPYKKKQRGIFSITVKNLHNLVLRIESNRLTNFAIRLGKVIHYEAASWSEAVEREEKAKNPSISPSTLGQKLITSLDLATSSQKLSDVDGAEKIASSLYWSSQGQTRIKQNEAFVRHCLSAIAVANITLERLVDPDGDVLEAFKQRSQQNESSSETGRKEQEKPNTNMKGDFLTQEPFDVAIQQLATDEPLQTVVDQQVEILFGHSNELYEKTYGDNPESLRIGFISTLRNTLRQLRNTSFHFNNISRFIQALESLNSTTSKQYPVLAENVRCYIQAHQKKRHELLISSLESAHVEFFLRDYQVKKLIQLLVAKRSSSLLTLPRFNRFLDWANRIRNEIIAPATTDKNSLPTYHCSFICLKKIYETDFKHWLEDRSVDQLNAYVKKAKDRSERESVKLKKETKVHCLPDIDEGLTLFDYFNIIARESAKEASLQQSKNRYQSSAEGAQKHSNFVDNFKQTFLVFAFLDYLQDGRLKGMGIWLKQLASKNWALRDKKFDIHELDKGSISVSENFSRPWLYMVLHLMPIEFVNHLSLQIKKQHVLGTEERFTELEQAIALYLDLHDASMNLKALHDEDTLAKFYEDTTIFKQRFKQNDNEALIPVRGLREILRFGNSAVLTQLFKGNQVVLDDVEQFEQLKLGIAEHQQKRKKLHEDLTRFDKRRIKNKTFNSMLNDYEEVLDKVVCYREFKNKVYLHFPKQVHQFIMSYIGRMIAYAQLWERDIYFVLLSLVFLRGKTVSGAENKNFRDAVKNGQILLALTKNKTESMEDVVNLLESLFNIDSNQQTRNDLAHINYLRSASDHVVLPDFTKLANRVRTMMAYDRKLKNAVAKSIEVLTDQHNLNIRFRMNHHDLVCIGLEKKTFSHIHPDHKIIEPLNADDVVILLKQLFQCK